MAIEADSVAEPVSALVPRAWTIGGVISTAPMSPATPNGRVAPR